jgi:uncharacterized protein
MIVYQASKLKFSEDVLADRIEERILHFFKKNLNKGTSKSEIRAWKNSLSYMDKVLNDPDIPDDCGVAIEYQIPQSGKRLDFILTGLSKETAEHAILIELKQWSEAQLSEMDGVIRSPFNGKLQNTPHPSYQAWSYASLLQHFNATIEEEKINLQPCAYLHNYVNDDVISNSHYKEYIEKAPMFFKGDAVKLRNFIKTYVKYGDKTKILYRIEQGKIRPSKVLAEAMVSLLAGNEEFVMIDEQKLVYESALSLSRSATYNKKQVLVVKGGPGTGKSVVAVNLLVEITRRELLTQYVSKNAAPRAVYVKNLSGSYSKVLISNMFIGSGGFYRQEANTFDTLIVDEAHRLTAQSGLYGNEGENQIKEIINAARCSIFFIDEDQRVTLKDIGTVNEIRNWADRADADFYEAELSSQFRCSGSDGYMAWLDYILQIRDTSNADFNPAEYEFKVFSSPNDLRDAIYEKNKINNKARMVAGYCWEWNSRRDDTVYDVSIPEFKFQMKWNLTTDGSLWIVSPKSVNEIGCIHTCQGLEVDYIGVIIGPDLLVENGQILTQPAARAKSDSSIRGYKKLIAEKPEEGKALVRTIIKNTYRTLMTRGMKGCYVYCVDKELGEYLKSGIDHSILP